MEPILLVDDDPSARACLREFLELKGYHCVEADHGGTALEKIAKESVSIVVTDYQMPVMNGLQLLQNLRQNPVTEDIPGILVTGELTDEVRISAVNAGVTIFFEKPFDFHALFFEISRATRYRRSLSMA